jgi:hypothetical protein
MRALSPLVLAGFVAAVIAASQPAAAPASEGTLQSTADSLSSNEGDRTETARTKSIIDRLSAETLEQSFENAAYVDDYFHPGYQSASIGDPFEQVEVVLSNRRFAKLLTGLKELGADEQYAFLDKYFRKYLAQYKEIVSYPIADGQRFDPQHSLARASEVAGWPPTAHGTRGALHSIVLLSGILGQPRMWPAVRDAFRYPVCGFDATGATLSPAAASFSERMPLFSEAIRAQVVFLMARNTTDADAAKVAFDRGAIMALVAKATEEASAAQAADTNPIRKQHGHETLR